MSAPRPPLSEDVLRRELASAADLIDPQPPTRAELQALTRRRRGVLRAAAPPLLVAAAVAAIAAVSVEVVSHSSQPRPPATTGPRPTPTVSSTPPAPAPSTSHPVVPPPSPSTKHSKPSTSGSDTGSATGHLTPPPAGLPLVPGAYGFLVPEGWHEHPLANYDGPASWASYTQGSGAAPLHGAAPFTEQYVLNGGSQSVYARDGSPILSQAVEQTNCAPTSWQATSSNTISFTCAPVDGQVPRGVLIVLPRPGGTKQLVVTLPADQQASVTRILDSFH